MNTFKLYFNGGFHTFDVWTAYGNISTFVYKDGFNPLEPDTTLVTCLSVRKHVPIEELRRIYRELKAKRP